LGREGAVNVDQIQIDDRNETHVTAHGISVEEVVQVFSNDPIVRRNRRDRRAEFTATGTTNGGRPVKIAFDYSAGTARPVTAWENR
jgi:uncharacterized DUF497 family protein